MVDIGITMHFSFVDALLLNFLFDNVLASMHWSLPVRITEDFIPWVFSEGWDIVRGVVGPKGIPVLIERKRKDKDLNVLGPWFARVLL